MNNGPLKWVYMNMLSTGPVWLIVFLIVVTALLPDVLIGIWEAYSAGDGVLVNLVRRFGLDFGVVQLTFARAC